MQAEVLYGVLGATGRLNDPEAAVEIMRVYNEWLADFCSAQPERFAGLASIPNNASKRRSPRSSASPSAAGARPRHREPADLKPLWDPYWDPLWEVIGRQPALPLHFHTIGGRSAPTLAKLAPEGRCGARGAAAHHQSR